MKMAASKSEKLSSIFSSMLKTSLKNESKPTSPSPSPSNLVTLQNLLKLSSKTSECSDTATEPSKPYVSSESDAASFGKTLSSILSSSSTMSHDLPTFQHHKEISRERKRRWIFKNTQSNRFERLVRTSAEKMGTDVAIQLFGKLGKETGVKQYNTLIALCIEKARESDDEEVSCDQLEKAFQLLSLMRERGFSLEEGTYSPFLVYLIDMGMVEEFQLLSKFIQDENPGSASRLGYYEMLLWIAMKNEQKVQELCDLVRNGSCHNYTLAENYLLALCKNDIQKEMLQLLDEVDITKVKSVECLRTIFNSLGRLLLENYMEKFIMAFKIKGTQDEYISSFICDYSISIPILTVDEVISKFRNLHRKLHVGPCIGSYEKLIARCCNSFKVHAALEVVHQMHQSGLVVSIDCLQPILHASEQSFDFNLVRPIYSLIRQHNLMPNSETFKSMISLTVKMKDFEGAYNMLKDFEEMGITATANIYNALMAGYFREKNITGALIVLQKMKKAKVEPDSDTYSYLISNSESEEDIVKYFEELQLAKLGVNKHVFMALVNAYAKFGQYEKAKQVLLDKRIPIKNMNEIKSSLVSALASNGQVVDALEVYEEVKKAEGRVEPKAIISLIEYIQYEGELDRLLQLLEELNESSSWYDGCSRIILYCVRHKHLSHAVSLLKQLQEKDEAATFVVLDQVFSQIWETEPTDLEAGFCLLRAVKEELRLCPSRTNLDFLLSACANAKDPACAELILKEYEEAGLPFNILTNMRMYIVLLASGEKKSANEWAKKIPKDDPHVRLILKACKETYS